MSGDCIKNENVGLFICASLSYLSKMFSFDNMGTLPVYKKKGIFLPVTRKGYIDYPLMEKCIRAIKKQILGRLQTLFIVDKTVSNRNDNRICEEKYEIDDANNDEDFSMAAEPFGCYKWEGFEQSIRDFFNNDQTILVGCYKGKTYRDWIDAHHLYNIRMGKTKGSMEANRELFDNTSLLVLYEIGKPDKLSAYKIVDHREIGKDELTGMGYPNKKPRKSYMAFSLEPLDMNLTFLVEHHLIERIIELGANHAKGTPIFIEP